MHPYLRRKCGITHQLYELIAVKTQSKASDAIFPLDGCDLSTISNQELVQILDTAPKLYQYGYTTVVRLSKTLVLKGGANILPSESQNMDFAAQLKGIRVPKVHRSFAIPAPEGALAHAKGYIVMDYVEGSSLADLWDTMNPTQREEVVTQVAEMIRKMQSTTLDFAGPVGGGVSLGVFFTDWGAGPFDSRRSMEDWFNHKLDVCKAFKRVPEDAPPFTFPTMVFTHGDISPRNIILDDESNVWLVDWGYAGSYPPQLEAAVIAEQSEFCDFKDMLLKNIEYDDGAVRQLTSIWYALTTGVFL
jgi:serine/threonine protein kinase